jgi:hypothetical protein
MVRPWRVEVATMAWVWGRRGSRRVVKGALSGACAGGCDLVVIGAVGLRMRVEKNALHGTPRQAAHVFSIPSASKCPSSAASCTEAFHSARRSLHWRPGVEIHLERSAR